MGSNWTVSKDAMPQPALHPAPDTQSSSLLPLLGPGRTTFLQSYPSPGLKSPDAGWGNRPGIPFRDPLAQFSSVPPNDPGLGSDWKAIFNLRSRHRETEFLTTNTASGIPKWSRRPFPAAVSKPHPSLPAAILRKHQSK